MRTRGMWGWIGKGGDAGGTSSALVSARKEGWWAESSNSALLGRGMRAISNKGSAHQGWRKKQTSLDAASEQVDGGSRAHPRCVEALPYAQPSTGSIMGVT